MSLAEDLKTKRDMDPLAAAASKRLAARFF
jgi:hypothetical protein